MKEITLLLLLLCGGFLIKAQTNTVNLLQFSTGYTSPLDIENCGDSRLFIVQQNGKIFISSSSGIKNVTPYLNITDRVNDTYNSQGLLGLAFDPDYLTNGYFYVDYINAGGHTQISRFKVSSNANKANSSSEKFILEIQQPFHFHNGGCLRFGPDGYLYIGTGDGDDDTGDPNNYSQNKKSFLGKMLRIDVHSGNPYSVPADNPFVGSSKYLPEIWALGLRNPWRYCFDNVTGNLIIADVGQDVWEEIDVQPASSNGGENYGWRCYEGNATFNTAGCQSRNKYTFPVSEYEHLASTGDCSITGGFVYRGSAYPELYGQYFYADYCSGIIRMLDIANPSNKHDVYFGDQYSYTSFGEGKNHELYVTNFTNGNIYHIIPAPALQKQSTTPVSITKALSVYPNPAHKEFTIAYHSLKEEQYILHFYNQIGVEVYTARHTFTAGANTWNISVPAGVNGNCYFTLAAASGTIASQKILIQ